MKGATTADVRYSCSAVGTTENSLPASGMVFECEVELDLDESTDHESRAIAEAGPCAVNARGRAKVRQAAERRGDVRDVEHNRCRRGADTEVTFDRPARACGCDRARRERDRGIGVDVEEAS